MSLKLPKIIMTIGHSTRTADDFIGLLRTHKIGHLVDVRTIPRSRHNPQFNTDDLRESLREAGIGYTHLPKLGGLRHAKRDSTNTGWRNNSFRGFADYMQSSEFEAGLATLIDTAIQKRTAIMCAEAVPWRCHRSLIADALTVRQIPVEHITSSAKAQPHVLTSFAKVDGTRIVYPAETLPF